MSETNDFLLAHRTRGADTTPKLAANGGVANVAADTSPAETKEVPPAVHILTAGGPEFNEFFPTFVSLGDDQLNAEFHCCQRMNDLAATLKQRKFDLALVQLHRTPPADHQFADTPEVVRRADSLFAHNDWIVWAGLEVASYLHSVHGIPVVVVSDTGCEEKEKLLAAQVGARALFAWLHMDLNAFHKCVRGILKP